jgi:hypothetical protein
MNSAGTNAITQEFLTGLPDCEQALKVNPTVIFFSIQAAAPQTEKVVPRRRL